MKVCKRLGVLFLLLSLLIPTTAFSVSGDGDIPEICPNALTGNGSPMVQDPEDMDAGFDWTLIWDMVVEVMVFLP